LYRLSSFQLLDGTLIVVMCCHHPPTNLNPVSGQGAVVYMFKADCRQLAHASNCESLLSCSVPDQCAGDLP